MEFYSKKIEVDIHDVDPNGVARLSSLMRYIQGAAQSQLTDNGKSYENLREMKRAFILSRIKLEFTETVRAYEKLEAETFPCDSRGFTFLRCYLLKKGGKTIGRAVSAWALIDTESHALVPVRDFELGLETASPLDFSLTRIAMPSELKKLGEYTVVYSDLDQNDHMNNTRYPDMYSNFLPLVGKRIDEITISYLNEAARGEKLTLLGAQVGEVFYIRSIKENGKINTEAEIHLTDI
jgi:acyl-ACP thioesterase